MLTAAQVETVAYQTEDGDMLCPHCFDIADTYARPVIRYALDEYDMAMSEYTFDESPDHADNCGCTMGVYCDACGVELSEPYVDPNCEDQREGADPDDWLRDPALD